ncbi:transmembrane protein, putative (macronuclear) [Tetrahymena thermophila SB210]|uniref:Transmembrane protein, putative n=1 Tax=Tetrahymena thermophila (strain SB210) TaxID=312017 RepID=W7X206_TETTS|nr:transmembrane protein, putative [Tetrahymena thermophila SB210]EWS71667.1 transmembrane protein, putative [Tetrahymena thermophila SB210]|eukprot:XP_012655799.1 transmembrane protein, putative [Tetrahymena thermophila SB210]
MYLYIIYKNGGITIALSKFRKSFLSKIINNHSIIILLLIFTFFNQIIYPTFTIYKKQILRRLPYENDVYLFRRLNQILYKVSKDKKNNSASVTLILSLIIYAQSQYCIIFSIFFQKNLWKCPKKCVLDNGRNRNQCQQKNTKNIFVTIFSAIISQCYLLFILLQTQELQNNLINIVLGDQYKQILANNYMIVLCIFNKCSTCQFIYCSKKHQKILYLFILKNVKE